MTGIFLAAISVSRSHFQYLKPSDTFEDLPFGGWYLTWSLGFKQAFLKAADLLTWALGHGLYKFSSGGLH